jgi:hypothetical protein
MKVEGEKLKPDKIGLKVKTDRFNLKLLKTITLFLFIVSLSYLFFNFNDQSLNLSSSIKAQTGGTTYYISPTGSDTNSGTSETAPLATFNKAWEYLYPGDTLILLDGVYRQRLNPNKRNGTATAPVTIRAKNDGLAIIDGDIDGDLNTIEDRICRPVQIGDTWSGESGQNPVGNYFVIEGLVVANGGRDSNGSCPGVVADMGYNGGMTIGIWGHHNILRRVSAYNNHTDVNGSIIGVIVGTNNLFEDCVAVGSGRKIIYTFGAKAQNNTFRRCFAAWQEWRGGSFDPGHWPWGDVMEFYHGVNNTIENSISYGMSPSVGFNVLNQSGVAADTFGNKVLA